MEHQLVLYDVDSRVVDQVITSSWESAKNILEGWNHRYGDDFTIVYKRYKPRNGPL